MKDKSLSRTVCESHGKTWQLFDVPLFGSSTDRLLKLLAEERLKKPVWIATVNPEFVMSARKDRDFLKILQERTSLNVMDGVGLAWAREVSSIKYQVSNIGRIKGFLKGVLVGVEILQGKHREELVTGADLVDRLCSTGAKKVFLLGGWGDRAERAADKLSIKYPVLSIKYSCGEPYEKNEETIKKINEFKPDYLFVAYGMKKQELWINENLEKLKVGLVMGVGRTFDYYSGDLKRAPKWVRRMGLEWLFSLIMEPKRWRRQLELPKFVWKVIFAKKSV